MSDIILAEENLTYDQKMAKVMLKLRQLRPFYSAIYESLEKVESSDVETIGVTTNKLIYNPEFIKKISTPEFLFICLHEIGHVALMHVARRENRDPNLWNIACDLYVNQSLVEEFDLKIGTLTERSNNTMIMPPSDGMYCSSIDIDKDYVEAIYEDFVKQGKQNGYFSSLSYGNGGNTSDSSDSENTPGFDQVYTFKYKGHKIPQGVRREKNEEYKEFKVEVTPDFTKDLIDTGEDGQVKDQQSRKILSDAVVRSEMRGSMAGDTPSNIERQVKELLKSRVDWKKLFKRYLTEIVSTDSSFSIPDKRMYWQKAIYPGQASEESNFIEGIKICIDTSGSISSEDLSGFWYQVQSILKQYKVDAELIYWDAIIQSVGSFQSIKEFERVDCSGGGGTMPEVVFNYLSKAKVKPKVILMFTDGYFSSDWESGINKKKFKDTIWVLTKDCNREFDPSFGRKAVVKFT